MAVYVNNLNSPVATIPLSPGAKSTQGIHASPGSVNLVQLNFYGPVGERIRLYSVEILNRQKVLVSFSPAELEQWSIAFLSTVKLQQSSATGAFTTLVPTQEASAMHEAMSVPAPFAFPLAAEAQDPVRRLTLVFWAGACLGLLALGLDPRYRRLAAVLFIGGAAVLGCLFIVANHPGGLTSPAGAVGRATYLGLSVSSNIHALEVMYVVAALFGIGGALWERKVYASGPVQGRGRVVRADLDPDMSPTVPDLPSRTELLTNDVTTGRRYQWPRPALNLLCWASAVLAAVAMFTPDILADVRGAALQTYPPSFDYANDLTWQVFAERGLVPMGDFWYPYGNSLFFVSHPVLGSFLFELFNLSLLAAYGWVFWRLSRASRWKTWLAVIALMMAEQFLPAFTRYGVAFLVPLAFWTIPPPGSPRRWLGQLIFALTVGAGLFIEPDPVFYGLVGLALSLLVELAVRRRQRIPFALQTAKQLGLAFALTGLYLVYTTLQGQLGGLLDIYGQSGTITAYSAYPAALATDLVSVLGIGGLVTWVPAVVLAAGLFLRVRYLRQDLLLGSILIGLAGAGFVLLEKDVIRPIPDQTRVTAAVAALVVLVGSRPLRDTDWTGRLRSLAVGGCVGALAAAIVGFPGLGALRSGLRYLPTTVHDDVRVLAHPAMLSAMEAQELAPARFADYQAELQVAAKVRPIVGPSQDSLFVLGDDPVLYVMLDKAPPWVVTAYNGSPISDQHRVVQWLKQHRPNVVIFDEATPSFDGVPSDVRIPLVYQAIVAAYMPIAHIGTYDVLEPRKPGQRPAAGFWSVQLGEVLNLGFLPDAMGTTAPKPGSARDRVPYLQIDRDQKPTGPTVVSVPLRFGRVSIDVTFNAQTGRKEFSIPLARVWAWSISHRPTLAGIPSPGWTATIDYGPLPANTLY